MNPLTIFINLLLTMVIAFACGLFVVLATGSLLFAWIVASATGVYCGIVDARRARKVRDGKTESAQEVSGPTETRE